MIHFNFRKFLSLFISASLTVSSILMPALISASDSVEQFKITGAAELSDFYVVTPDDDSYYNMGYQTVLYADDAALNNLRPDFGSATDVSAKTGGGSYGVTQTSKVTPVDFSNSVNIPVQYTASGRNYWVSFVKKQDAPKLFVNGLDYSDTARMRDLSKNKINEIIENEQFAVVGGITRSYIIEKFKEILDTLKLMLPEIFGSINTDDLENNLQIRQIFDALIPAPTLRNLNNNNELEYINISFDTLKAILGKMCDELFNRDIVKDIIMPKREIFLDSAANYHDIFIANIGNKNLYVEATFFESIYNANISTEDGFTSRISLSCPAVFSDLSGNKIRIVPVTAGATGAISEVLSITVYDEDLYDELSDYNDIIETFYIYLTGYAGELNLTTDRIPEAVKYVPYAVQILNNNKYEWNKISMKLTGGRLPDGLTLKTNGQISGVPKETGNFTFTVTMTSSDSRFGDDSQTYNLVVGSNTNDNVANSTDPDYDIEKFIGTLTDLPNDYILKDIPSDGVLFQSKGPYKNFMKKVWLNGKLLTRGTDYTDEEGSTKITIRDQTLRDSSKTDQTGINTIAAEFREEGDENKEMKVAAQNFRLDLPEPPKPTPSPTTAPGSDAIPPPNPSSPVIVIKDQTLDGDPPNLTTVPATQPVIEETTATPSKPAEPDTTKPTEYITAGNSEPPSVPATDTTEEEPPFELHEEPDITETIEIDGGGATVIADVKDGDIEKGLDNLEDKKGAGETGALEIVINTPEETNPDEVIVTLTVEALKLMAEAAAKGSLDSLIIKSPFATLTFSTDIIETMLADLYARGEDALVITINRKPDLTAAQRETIGDNPAVGITFMIGGVYVTELGGTLTVDIPYTLKPGQKGGGVYVHHVSDGGKSERMPTRYIDGKAIFTTTHLSVYAAGYEEPAAQTTEPKDKNPTTGDSMAVVSGLMMFAAAGCLAAGAYYRKRKI